MKITLTGKQLSSAPKSYTRVTSTEKRQVFFRENADETSTLVVGAGPYAEVTRRHFITLCRTMVRTAREQKLTHLAVDFTEKLFPQLADIGEEELYSIIAENLHIANYEFDTYKSKKKSTYALKEVLVTGIATAGAKRGIARGETVGAYVNHCRDIANTPGGDMTPKLLAQIAQALTKGTKVKTTILNKAQITKLKMGALLGVAKGSKEDPRFIILEYWGSKKPEASSKNKGAGAPIVFVGKGITFDTGGLNLKPGDGMLEMHLDMSGGAAVIAAITAAARLGLKRNIVGLIPAAENSVSGESFRPGDILTSMSGKTIDVLNTDAEGRLILADALTYAKRYNPALVVDVATLTGAALVALGAHASALMTKDEHVAEQLLALSEESGDYLWRLPLWDEYKQYTKGMHADVANIPWHGNPRAGGAINGGMFLTHFADGYPWAHIDMAPRMTPAPGDKLARGATGEPVRLLVKIAEKYTS